VHYKKVSLTDSRDDDTDGLVEIPNLDFMAKQYASDTNLTELTQLTSDDDFHL